MPRPVSSTTRRTTTTRKPPPTTAESTTPTPEPTESEVESWQPRFHVIQTTPYIIAVGLLFVVIGVALTYALQQVRETVVDYTHCPQSKDPKRTCAQAVQSPTGPSCYCEVPVFVGSDIGAPVSLFYALTNFYQNHRSYVFSKDHRQLRGELSDEVVSECKPFDTVIEKGGPKTIAPCGAIANSMFSDALALYSVTNNVTVPLLRKGIAWPQIKRQFRNPPGDLKTAFQSYAKPVAWRRNVWELDPADPTNNGLENEDFIVWMQPATSSSFRKLYRRVDHSAELFKEGLPKGRYELRVQYNYPVAGFDGTKSIIIANTYAFGVRNAFLSTAFIIVGSIYLILGLLFVFIRFRFKNIVMPRD